MSEEDDLDWKFMVGFGIFMLCMLIGLRIYMFGFQ